MTSQRAYLAQSATGLAVGLMVQIISCLSAADGHAEFPHSRLLPQSTARTLERSRDIFDGSLAFRMLAQTTPDAQRALPCWLSVEDEPFTAFFPPHFKESSLFHAAHNAQRGLLLRGPCRIIPSSNL
jgi:hypothetical protein